MSHFRRSDLFSSKPQSYMPESLVQKEPKPVFPTVSQASASAHRPPLDISCASFAAKDDSRLAAPAPAIFEDKIWTRVRSSDREDWRTLLSVKIETKAPSGRTKEQAISIELTDEKDPFFFFMMECSETDFVALKNEQNLLMDFQQFPAMVVELLSHCQSQGKENVTSAEDQAKYGCVLCVGYSADAVFSVIETNQFKQLTHLSLRFRTGDDETLKQYLAKTLSTYKTQAESLAARLETTEDALNVQTNQNEKLRLDLKHEQDEAAKQADSLRLDAQKQFNSLKEQMLAELESSGEKHTEEKERSRADCEAQLGELGRKLEELREQNADLTDRRLKLEASERELTAKTGSMEHTIKLQEEELKMLRGANQGLDTTKYTQEKELIELKVRCETMERQLQDREQLVGKTSGLYEANRAQCAHLEETIAILKANAAKMEDKLKQGVQEIIKGNEIIRQLQTETKAQKQKCKLKEGVIGQQEQVIEQNRKSADELTRAISDLKREMGYKEDETRLGKTKVEELTKKLEESQKLLSSNDQSIVSR